MILFSLVNKEEGCSIAQELPNSLTSCMNATFWILPQREGGLLGTVITTASTFSLRSLTEALQILIGGSPSLKPLLKSSASLTLIIILSSFDLVASILQGVLDFFRFEAAWIDHEEYADLVVEPGIPLTIIQLWLSTKLEKILSLSIKKCLVTFFKERSTLRRVSKVSKSV